jgi:hypothetical protein
MGRRKPAPSIAPLQTKFIESQSIQALEFRVDPSTIADANMWERQR